MVDAVVLDEVLIWLMVMMRLTGMVFFNTLLGRNNVPAIFRVGLVLALTYLVMSFLPMPELTFDTWIGFGVTLVKELLIGFFMGYIISSVLGICMVAGELLDMQLGIAMAKIYDPQSNVSMPVTGSIFNAMFILNFFLANGHLTLIYLMVQSFRVIPLGNIPFNDDILIHAIVFFATLLSLALKLALPFIAIQMVVEVAVGILMKAIPQINVFVLNIQLKLLIGFLLIFFLIPEIAEFMDGILVVLIENLDAGIFDLRGEING